MAQQRFYTIPKSEWDEMKAVLQGNDLISEDEAAKLLGMKKVSLRNRRYEGKIPADCYTVPKVGNVVYFKSKLLNLKY